MANVSKNGKICNYPRELLNSRLYKIWQNMKTRCSNKKVDSYSRYGGRGIGYCKEWETFAGFLDSMPDGYSETLTLDRIDNNKGYSKENCRWASYKEQALNRKSTRLFELNGRALTLTDWAKELGIKRSTLAQRFYSYGWSLEKTLTAQ